MRLRFRTIHFFFGLLIAATATSLSAQDVRWKKPNVRPLPKSESSEIIQVVYNEPFEVAQIQQKPMTPAQLDTVFPEKRPQPQQPFMLTAPQPAPAISAPVPFQIPEQPAAPQPTEEKQQSSNTDSTSSPSSDSSSAKFSTSPTTQKPAPQPAPVQTVDPTTVAPAMPMPIQSDLLNPATGTHVITAEPKCPEDIGIRSIRDISIDIRPKIESDKALPKECPLAMQVYQPRHFSLTCYRWKAAALCTKGAYFEDVQRERYGHTACPALQPVCSGVRFLADVVLLPYKMGLETPNECVYTLGHYRVGNCAPHMLDPLPLSLRGALYETGAVLGAVYLIP